jgi:hypothetical protein
MKLSISGGGHTKPTIGGRGDDHAICNLINEVQIPVAVSAIRNPALRALFAYSVTILGRVKKTAGCKVTCRREAPDNLIVSQDFAKEKHHVHVSANCEGSDDGSDASDGDPAQTRPKAEEPARAESIPRLWWTSPSPWKTVNDCPGASTRWGPFLFRGARHRTDPRSAACFSNLIRNGFYED